MKIWIVVVLAVVLIAGGFFLFNRDSEMVDASANERIIDGGSNEKATNNEESPSVIGWRESVLVDVNTGEEFTISQFEEPVLIESFAIWCPTCKKQQQEVKELHDELGDSIVSIGLDTDPNEDSEQVKKYSEDNGFDWRYVVSPTEVTQGLIDEFGVGVANAPSAPVILICNGEARLLNRGIKDVEELKGELEGC